MNRIDFTQTDGFPLETETLDKMQTAYNMFNALGALVNNRAIISGCKITGNTVGNGFIYFDGEILPFVGGNVQSKIIISTETTEREFENGEIKPVYYRRYARFGTGTQAINWSDFKRVDTILQLMGRLQVLENKPDKTVAPATQAEVNARSITSKYVSPNTLPNIPNAVSPASQAEVNARMISNKYVSPATLPPQSVSPVLMTGKINYNGNKISRYIKDFASRRLGSGHYRITHNLGTTNYGLVGAGINKGVTKVGIQTQYAQYCDVYTSDDHSKSDASFSFIIFKTA